MSGAEHHCWREFLGLSTPFVADQLGVSTKTVNIWESRADNVPLMANAQMRKWVTETARVVGILTVKGNDPCTVPRNDDPNANAMPPSWYRCVACRVAERTGRGIQWQ